MTQPLLARARRLSVALIVALAGLLPAGVLPSGVSSAGIVAPAKTSAGLPAHASGVVIVGFRPAVGRSDRSAVRSSLGVRSAAPLSPLAGDAERWTLPSEADLGPALAALANDPRIRYAEPDWKVTSAVDSNDPAYTGGTLWGMHGDAIAPGANQYGTGADEAWRTGYTGSSSVYVGVIDEGIQFTHPDLAANVWTNPAEAAGRAGVDDDGNGYIDDLHGWDFSNNDAGIYDTGADNHGTHVSGTIGGVGGNGAGVAGVNWRVSLISGKFLGPGGGYISDAIRAVDYLTDLKVRKGLNIVATSNSWGGGGFSQALLDAIDRGGDQGILFIAAAGNDGSNNDSVASFPSGYQCTKGGTRGWDCVVSVAAIDAAGSLAWFSNYGTASVDLGAPGVNVYSTLPTDSYGAYDGTSMATPHVSGAAALCASIDPSLGARGIRDALMNSARATASLSGRTATGGRLDIGAMVPYCLPALAPVDGAPSALAATTGDPWSVRLSWSDGSTNESAFEVQRGPAGGACDGWTAVADAPMGATSALVGGLDPSTDYCFRVLARNTYGGTSYSAPSGTAAGRTADAPPPYVCAPATYAWVTPASGAMTLSDDSWANRPLGFTFTHYGRAYTSANVSANGFVRLGTDVAGAFQNTALPDPTDPNGIVAAAWDDWNPGAGGAVTGETVGVAPNRRFVATWTNVPPWGVTGTATFQAILEEGTNAFVLQYADMAVGTSTLDYGISATAGTEDAQGRLGTQVSANTRSLLDGTAIRCVAGAAEPIVTGATLPNATLGSAYASTLTAQGGTSPYTWSLVAGGGALPSGLSLTSTGSIAGTPAAGAVSSSFTVKVVGKDGLASTATRTIAVAPPVAVTSTSLAGFTAGAAGSGSLTASGGTGAYTWERTGGTLPGGLSLASAGGISGTPTQSGVFAVGVRATDGGAPARTGSGVVSVVVTPGKTTPASGAKFSNKTASVTLGWAADAGASKYRWCATTGTTCTSYVETTATFATVTVARGATYTWQAWACRGTCTTADAAGWTPANGPSGYWRFSISR